MTLQEPVGSPEPAKLTANAFLMLRGFGAFDSYWKAELLDGELWGIPANETGDEPESDETFPIRLTIEYYELLAQAGLFVDYRRTELIDGRVYGMSPQHRPHGFVKDELSYRLRRGLEAMGSSLYVATEQSVAIAPFSEPQPDITLTSEPSGPGAIPVASVAFVVEVSDATSSFDRKQKAALYAAAGIAEYWIADVNRRTVRRLWSPQRGVYEEQADSPFGHDLSSETIAGLVIDTNGL